MNSSEFTVRSGNTDVLTASYALYALFRVLVPAGIPAASVVSFVNDIGSRRVRDSSDTVVVYTGSASACTAVSDALQRFRVPAFVGVAEDLVAFTSTVLAGARASVDLSGSASISSYDVQRVGAKVLLSPVAPVFGSPLPILSALPQTPLVDFGDVSLDDVSAQFFMRNQMGDTVVLRRVLAGGEFSLAELDAAVRSLEILRLRLSASSFSGLGFSVSEVELLSQVLMAKGLEISES